LKPWANTSARISALIRCQRLTGPSSPYTSTAHRYVNAPETDGLKGGESTSLAGSLWLVDA
jgi:hypothetical protein